MRKATIFSGAREAVKVFQGKPLINAQTGMVAVVSRNSLDKMLSSTAVNKSERPDVHATAVANVDSLFERAILGWSKPDREGAAANIVAVHRFFAQMWFDGRFKMVKITIKETARDDQPNPLYTVEVVEFNEKFPKEIFDATKWRPRRGGRKGHKNPPQLRGWTRLFDPMGSTRLPSSLRGMCLI